MFQSSHFSSRENLGYLLDIISVGSAYHLHLCLIRLYIKFQLRKLTSDLKAVPLLFCSNTYMLENIFLNNIFLKDVYKENIIWNEGYEVDLLLNLRENKLLAFILNKN